MDSNEIDGDPIIDLILLMSLKFDKFINLVKAVETGTREIKLPSIMLKTESAFIANNEKMDETEVLRQLYLSSLDRVMKNTLKSAQVFAKTGGVGWEAKTLELCGILTARLSCGNQEEEEEDIVGKKEGLQEKLVRDFLFHSSLINNELFITVLVTSLHLEYAGENNGKRYETFFLLVLKNMLSNQPLPEVAIKTRLNEVLKQAPCVPSKVILFLITQFCYGEGNEKISIGLSALNQLFLTRPTARGMLLSFFLSFAYEKEGGKLKELTIKLLSNRVWSFIVSSKLAIFSKSISNLS